MRERVPEKKPPAEGLKALGSTVTEYATDRPTPEKLETFPNPKPGAGYDVEFTSYEFTSLCPVTGQPDFADVRIRYQPNARCVETKSLKLYLFSFRNAKAFMEDVTNQIADALIELLDPTALAVTMSFGARGGIQTVVTRGYGKRMDAEVVDVGGKAVTDRTEAK